jgi:cytochrome b involved in lipid metabolism
MGWLKALHNKTTYTPEQVPIVYEVNDKGHSSLHQTLHIEDISKPSNTPHDTLQHLLFVSANIPDIDLPYLSAAQIDSKKTDLHKYEEDRLYIVVENIVYDCTQFIQDHPGGSRIIESFQGQDCSWQFWRFHSKEVMEKWGRPLRVARTEGVRNRWKEIPRYVGLRKLGAVEDEY